uniref:Uncharacterized protein n=1 Tax=Anguilla anguilla TaxID=7936 RepID=A0A0E9QRL1_ANGAN
MLQFLGKLGVLFLSDLIKWV